MTKPRRIKKIEKKKRRRRLIRSTSDVPGFLSTGSTLLDFAIAGLEDKRGGIPEKRITELFGGPASGKTFICHEVVGEAQRKGYDEIYVFDIEHRWDLNRMDLFGIDPEHESFNYIDPIPSTVKELAGKVKSILGIKIEEKEKKKSEVVFTRDLTETKILIIVDPIAALTTEWEMMDRDMAAAHRAIDMHSFIRQCKSFAELGNISMLITNQEIDRIGGFGGGKDTPVGKAPKHYASVRVRFWAGSEIESSKGVPLGVYARFKVVKNSVDAAFRSGAFPIYFGYGIGDVDSCVDWLIGNSDVFQTLVQSGKNKGKPSKTHFAWPGADVSMYRKELVKYIEDNDLEKELLRLTGEVWREHHAFPERKPRRRI